MQQCALNTAEKLHDLLYCQAPMLNFKSMCNHPSLLYHPIQKKQDINLRNKKISCSVIKKDTMKAVSPGPPSAFLLRSTRHALRDITHLRSATGFLSPKKHERKIRESKKQKIQIPCYHLDIKTNTVQKERRKT